VYLSSWKAKEKETTIDVDADEDIDVDEDVGEDVAGEECGCFERPSDQTAVSLIIL
jgi:hypothetical protein